MVKIEIYQLKRIRINILIIIKYSILFFLRVVAANQPSENSQNF